MNKFFSKIWLWLVLYGVGSNAQDNYFQQRVSYDIQVTLNVKEKSLTGFEKIVYVNQSPDYLSYIKFHLWPNAYKDYRTELSKQLVENNDVSLHFAPPGERGYIDMVDFKVNNQPVAWYFEDVSQEIAVIPLEKPLAPGDSIIISTPFHVKIPYGRFSRLGHTGNDFQITQWYPKPAVYDHKGWHDMPYLDQGEFYSEFGDFKVAITLPDHYLVAATGELKNEQEKKRLLKLAENTRQKLKFIPGELPDFPADTSAVKTLVYEAKNVHDFAWFASPSYFVLKGEVTLPHSKRKVELWSYFTARYGNLWKNSIEYLHDAIYYYSLWNGDYPYPQMTAADGALSAGAGMEYPMVTVIGSVVDAFSLETVIMHEVGHNWFYGVLGSNERQHPWMDEGVNSFNELRYIETKYPNATIASKDPSNGFTKIFNLDQPHRFQYEWLYTYTAARNEDQPIELPANEYSSINYGAIVYSKTALMFNYLRHYLGDTLFDRCMQAYFRRWQFKHPYPEDMQQVFEETSGKSLKWFYNELFHSTYFADLKIKRIKTTDSTRTLILYNKSDFALPVPISAVRFNGHYTTFWTGPFKGRYEITLPKDSSVKKYVVDYHMYFPQSGRNNDFIHTKGLFKRMTSLSFKPIMGMQETRKYEIYYFPVIGYNLNDRIMPGIWLHNVRPYPQNFEWMIAPMWSIKNNTLTGFAGVRKNIIFEHGRFKRLYIQTTTRTFHAGLPDIYGPYWKISPLARLELKPRNYRIGKSLAFNTRMVYAQQEEKNFDTQQMEKKSQIFYEFFIDYKKRHPIDPFNFVWKIQAHRQFVKTSMDVSFFFRYNEKPKHGLTIRYFLGAFLYNQSNNPVYDFQFSQNPDYTFDEIYLARNNNTNQIFNRQIAPVDAMFRTYVTAPTGNQWMSAINLASTFPNMFFQFYLNAGLSGYEQYNNRGDLESLVSNPVWETGVALRIIPDVFEFYFPIAQSSNLNALKYNQRIRFMLNLKLVNPFQIPNIDISLF